VKPRIQVAAGPLADSTYLLTDAEMRIGRDPSNSLAISDLSLSRRHCVLVREADGYTLRDLDSRWKRTRMKRPRTASNLTTA
jgi:pSer/pThr/pTyr-binding forkhead associated (FHA) protein